MHERGTIGWNRLIAADPCDCRRKADKEANIYTEAIASGDIFHKVLDFEKGTINVFTFVGISELKSIRFLLQFKTWASSNVG